MPAAERIVLEGQVSKSGAGASPSKRRSTVKVIPTKLRIAVVVTAVSRSVETDVVDSVEVASVVEGVGDKGSIARPHSR